MLHPTEGKCVWLVAGLIVAPILSLYGQSPQKAKTRIHATTPTDGRLRIPDRPSKSLFEGDQGKQRSEVHFDSATGLVTIKFLVQDSNGYFIPNIRRENFVVYENGISQRNATVEVEHAPISLGLLLEWGGRSPRVNAAIADEAGRAARSVLDYLGREDKCSAWTYADSVQPLPGLSIRHGAVDDVFLELKAPGISEANLFDALPVIFAQMQSAEGRKAIILISSGMDTFSKATFDDALISARKSNTPLYVIGLGPILRGLAGMFEGPDPLSRINWKQVENNLYELARASGGRAYFRPTSVDLAPAYDDIMENLRVRYVITYKSSSTSNPDLPRKVDVRLVNPKTGTPLQIVDVGGKTIQANVSVEASYVPSQASQK